MYKACCFLVHLAHNSNLQIIFLRVHIACSKKKKWRGERKMLKKFACFELSGHVVASLARKDNLKFFSPQTILISFHVLF